jgi:hypothetical protein
MEAVDYGDLDPGFGLKQLGEHEFGRRFEEVDKPTVTRALDIYQANPCKLRRLQRVDNDMSTWLRISIECCARKQCRYAVSKPDLERCIGFDLFEHRNDQLAFGFAHLGAQRPANAMRISDLVGL